MLNNQVVEDNTVTVKIELNLKNQVSGYVFENKIVGGSIPKEYIPAIDAGIQEAMANWYSCWISQLLDIKVEVI